MLWGVGRGAATEAISGQIWIGNLRAMAPKRKAAAAAAPVLKAQGATTKRTPTSHFDDAAGKDIYEPEKIIAQRLAKLRHHAVSGDVEGLREQAQHVGANRKPGRPART